MARIQEEIPDEIHRGILAPELIERVRLALARRNWTQADAAKAAGVAVSSVNALLKGRRVQSHTLEKICKALLDNPARSAIAEFMDREQAV